MRDYPQESHADLGLIEGEDKTEDLRPRNETAPELPVLAHQAGTARHLVRADLGNAPRLAGLFKSGF